MKKKNYWHRTGIRTPVLTRSLREYIRSNTDFFTERNNSIQ